jgi:cation transport ATPase
LLPAPSEKANLGTRSKRTVGELLEFQKKMAWVLRGNVITAQPVSALQTGDTVVVHSGEMIPVDGEILTGHGMIDQKTITGESLPVLRAEGEAVYAATGLREGYLSIRITRVGSQTTAVQIVKLGRINPAAHTCVTSSDHAVCKPDPNTGHGRRLSRERASLPTPRPTRK